MARPTPYDAQWRTVRLTILERDDHTCQLNLEGCTHHADAVDHIVPLNEGGRRLDPDNLRAACTPCNSRRNRQRQTQLAQHALRAATGAPTPSRSW